VIKKRASVPSVQKGDGVKRGKEWRKFLGTHAAEHSGLGLASCPSAQGRAYCGRRPGFLGQRIRLNGTAGLTSLGIVFEDFEEEEEKGKPV